MVEPRAPPPSIVVSNKRSNDSASDSPIPAKRSRGVSSVGGAPQRGESPAAENQMKDNARDMSKYDLDPSVVFKKPPLPGSSTGSSSVEDSRGSRRATRSSSSSVPHPDHSGSPLSKRSRKLARADKSLITVPESSTSVGGTVATLDGPVAARDDTAGPVEVDPTGNNDSVFDKNPPLEEAKEVVTNSKKSVTSADTDSFSVLNDFVPTSKKCESVPKATKGPKPPGSPNPSSRNSSEDAAKLRKTKIGSADVCHAKKNEDSEMLKKERSSSLCKNHLI